MKKHLAVIAVIMVSMAVFIPLASSSPDGLERVAENFGVAEQAPIWNGIMSGYAIAAIQNPYVSTLLAGVFGTLMVLLVGFLLGKTIAPKNPKVQE
jgi:cobalt/nickel transport protein